MPSTDHAVRCPDCGGRGQQLLARDLSGRSHPTGQTICVEGRCLPGQLDLVQGVDVVGTVHQVPAGDALALCGATVTGGAGEGRGCFVCRRIVRERARR